MRACKPASPVEPRAGVYPARSLGGATLETWVYAEQRKALSLSAEDWFLSHFRDKDQVEVDFVLESPLRQLIGIEVKGLKKLQSLAGDAFTTGLVLYDGHQALSFGPGLWAVPLAAL